jgi:hypothetical protein
MESTALDFIAIVPTYEIGANDIVDRSSPVGFSIHYVRLNHPQAAEQFLAGVPPKQLPSGFVGEFGDVLAPDGTALAPNAIGSQAIDNWDDAVDVLQRSFRNSNSVLVRRGFSPNTPIYNWQAGKAAIRA